MNYKKTPAAQFINNAMEDIHTRKEVILMVYINSNYIRWKQVSANVTPDYISYEYEAPISNFHRKYHLSVIVTPESEYRSYSII